MTMKRVIFSLGLLIAFATIVILLFSGQDDPTMISGIVADSSGPVEGALVRFRGYPNHTFSGVDGRFEIAYLDTSENIYVTAWKPGYYIAGFDEAITAESEDIQITMHHYHPEDNPDYRFISPLLDMDNEFACGNCHLARGEILDTNLPVNEWLQDAHSQSAVNQRFLSLYNGTSLSGERGDNIEYQFDSASGIDIPVAPSLGLDEVGPGFRLDFPDLSGSCATCHVPVAALDAPFTTDPNHAEGVELEGATCDFCHKIQDVGLRENGLPEPGLPGILSLQMLRRMKVSKSSSVNSMT